MSKPRVRVSRTVEKGRETLNTVSEPLSWTVFGNRKVVFFQGKQQKHCVMLYFTLFPNIIITVETLINHMIYKSYKIQKKIKLLNFVNLS